MTKIDISPEAVARMLDGVTPGPWETGQSSWNEYGEVQYTLHGIKRAGYADCMFIAYAREAVPALSAALADVQAENARLREVLAPLAEMAERYDPEDDDGSLECWSRYATPRIKHLRAARAALQEDKSRE